MPLTDLQLALMLVGEKEVVLAKYMQENQTLGVEIERLKAEVEKLKNGHSGSSSNEGDDQAGTSPSGVFPPR